MSALKIAIAGVNGRMGRVLVEAVNNHPDTVLSGALEHSGSEVLGLDAGFASGLKTGVTISDDVDAVLAQSDVLIDFTRPEPTLKHLQNAWKKASTSSSARPVLTMQAKPPSKPQAKNRRCLCSQLQRRRQPDLPYPRHRRPRVERRLRHRNHRRPPPPQSRCPKRYRVAHG